MQYTIYQIHTHMHVCVYSSVLRVLTCAALYSHICHIIIHICHIIILRVLTCVALYSLYKAYHI